VPTIMHAYRDVQWPRVLLTLAFAATILLVLALSSPTHASLLTSLLGHVQAMHAGAHVLAGGTPPPPPGGCGGAVGTHC
jgi:hypothetical protein